MVTGTLTANGSACTGGSLTVASNGIVTVSIGGNNGSSVLRPWPCT
ncbi:hypothetical protein LP419_21660 [Massilia sp. H-1]|nr:hypothetical protein LP419_21660 [Massilia sp. H-1]